MITEADLLYTKLWELNFAEKDHDEPWRNEVAKELNELLGRAEYWMETNGDDSDMDFGKAVLSICNRVSEFDKIMPCTRQELIAMQTTKASLKAAQVLQTR